MIRVVGVDLSLTGTGLAAGTVDPQPGWDLRTIETASVSGTLRTWGRLTRIADEVEEFCSGANLAVVEQPNYSATRGSHAADRAGLFWMVVDRLYRAGTPVAFVTSGGRAKYATGKGTSPKDAVLAAAVRRYVDAPISNNNEADATVLAAMGLRWLGWPVEKSIGLAHLAALDPVEWPRGYEKRQPTDTPLPLYPQEMTGRTAP